MNHITTTDLLEHLKWRYATKQFDPAKRITPEIWTALEDALVLTPSSYGLQPWKFRNISITPGKQENAEKSATA